MDENDIDELGELFKTIGYQMVEAGEIMAGGSGGSDAGSDGSPGLSNHFNEFSGVVYQVVVDADEWLVTGQVVERVRAVWGDEDGLSKSVANSLKSLATSDSTDVVRVDISDENAGKPRYAYATQEVAEAVDPPDEAPTRNHIVETALKHADGFVTPEEVADILETTDFGFSDRKVKAVVDDITTATWDAWEASGGDILVRNRGKGSGPAKYAHVDALGEQPPVIDENGRVYEALVAVESAEQDNGGAVGIKSVEQRLEYDQPTVMRLVKQLETKRMVEEDGDGQWAVTEIGRGAVGNGGQP